MLAPAMKAITTYKESVARFPNTMAGEDFKGYK